MSPFEAGDAALAAIPRVAGGLMDEPVFPAPWAARAFALAVALNERGLFTWSEWAEALGAALRDAPGSDPEAYWRCWLAALEDMLRRKQVAVATELPELQDAWRRAAERTPHGEPIELLRGR